MEQTALEQLIESVGSYTPPTDSIKLCFDFYCLYALAYKYGFLWSAYHQSLPQQNIVYARVEQWVNEAFEQVRAKVMGLMLQHVPRVCLVEAFHCFDFTQELSAENCLDAMSPPGEDNFKYLTNSEALLAHIKQLSPDELWSRAQTFVNPVSHSAAESLLLTKMLTYALQHGQLAPYSSLGFTGDIGENRIDDFIQTQLKGKLPISAIGDIFLLTWSDAYGGENWYRICQLIEELQTSKQTKDSVFRIDQLYDIQHNTGSLLSKIPELYVPPRMLDIRAFLTDPRDFEPYVSPDCQKIVRALARFLQNDTTGQQTRSVQEPLTVLNPAPAKWAAIRVTEAYGADSKPVWMAQSIVARGLIEIDDYALNGALLRGVKAYVDRFGRVAMMVQPQDVQKGIARYIPSVSEAIPIVAARTPEGWKVKADGFFFDGQVWPLDSFVEADKSPH